MPGRADQTDAHHRFRSVIYYMLMHIAQRGSTSFVSFVCVNIFVREAGQAKIDDDIDDEVSPIDETLRTKWGMRAHVDWNGVEKIL